jgi:hypothetical protein
MDEAALRRAVEARVARDFQTLTPAAQERYRAALRAQMRAAPCGAPADPSTAAGGLGIALLAVATVALVAVALGVVAAAVLGVVGLAVMAGARREEGAAATPISGAPGAMASERVMAMHLAAMAQSRRAYYLDESAAGAQQSRRVV